MKIERTQVFGWRPAIRGMRNPFESWAKSDSSFSGGSYVAIGDDPGNGETYLGPNDKRLMLSLIRQGGDHRKFLRMIAIWADLTLPRYVWTEFDTYKIGTVRNSCSTMNKLGRRELTVDDFQGGDVFPEVLERLNAAGKAYREKVPFTLKIEVSDGGQTFIQSLEGYDIVRWMKRHVPEGLLQTATIELNYEVALRMLRSRRDHRLPEWNASNLNSICAWLRSLPYMREFEEAFGA